MIENSTSVYFGGLTIITESSKEVPYHIVVKSPGIIWEGSLAEFEAMCESHKLLIDACNKLINLPKAKDEDAINEFITVLKLTQKALRIADIEF